MRLSLSSSQMKIARIADRDRFWASGLEGLEGLDAGVEHAKTSEWDPEDLKLYKPSEGMKESKLKEQKVKSKKERIMRESNRVSRNLRDKCSLDEQFMLKEKLDDPGFSHDDCLTVCNSSSIKPIPR